MQVLTVKFITQYNFQTITLSQGLLKNISCQCSRTIHFFPMLQSPTLQCSNQQLADFRLTN